MGSFVEAGDAFAYMDKRTVDTRASAWQLLLSNALSSGLVKFSLENTFTSSIQRMNEAISSAPFGTWNSNEITNEKYVNFDELTVAQIDEMSLGIDENQSMAKWLKNCSNPFEHKENWLPWNWIFSILSRLPFTLLMCNRLLGFVCEQNFIVLKFGQIVHEWPTELTTSPINIHMRV